MCTGTSWVSMVLGPVQRAFMMATNPAVSSEAGIVELLGRECCDDYFNKAVGGDSIMDLGDTSADVDITNNACTMESIVDELQLEIC